MKYFRYKNIKRRKQPFLNFLFQHLKILLLWKAFFIFSPWNSLQYGALIIADSHTRISSPEKYFQKNYVVNVKRAIKKQNKSKYVIKIYYSNLELQVWYSKLHLQNPASFPWLHIAVTLSPIPEPTSKSEISNLGTTDKVK